VSEAFASCQWPENNLVGAANLVGTIYNEDGSIQDADITVTNENGMIYLDAKNFHYSAPIFQITASGTAIKPGSTISSPKPSSSATPTSKPSPSESSESSESSANPEELRTLETTEVTATSEETNSGAYFAIGVFLALVVATVAYAWIRKRKGKPFLPDTLKKSISKFTKRKHKNF
jgi:cobalamin biosynthesis Mg chelatase CobN